MNGERIVAQGTAGERLRAYGEGDVTGDCSYTMEGRSIRACSTDMN